MSEADSTEPKNQDTSESSPEPERAPILPGLYYASIRNDLNLGTAPHPQHTDPDWGVQEGFKVLTRERPEVLSAESLDKLFTNSFSKNAPNITELRNGLITRCRKAHFEELKKRRACPKRKTIEEELKKTAEDV